MDILNADPQKLINDAAKQIDPQAAASSTLPASPPEVDPSTPPPAPVIEPPPKPVELPKPEEFPKLKEEAVLPPQPPDIPTPPPPPSVPDMPPAEPLQSTTFGAPTPSKETKPQMPPPSSPPKKGGAGRGVLLAGLLVLLVALPIGIYYVSQQQKQITEQRSKAAGAACGTIDVSCCDPFSSGGKICDSGLFCNTSTGKCQSSAPSNLCSSGKPVGTKCEVFTCGSTCNNGNQCSLNPTIVDCSAATIGGQCGQIDFLDTSNNYCGVKSQNCGGSCAGGTTNSTATTSFITQGSQSCGSSCSSSADCRTPANGGVAVCRNGICENEACPAGKTIPGANCDCGVNNNRCGQRCSASLGLCAPNQGSCAYVVGPSCSDPITGTYCTGTANGYTKKNCVSRDTGNSYLIGPGGKTSGFSATELASSCQVCGDGDIQGSEQCDDGKLNGTAQSRCDTTCHIVTAGQCTRIKVYKGTTAVDPTTLQPGDTVTVAVAGTNATKGRIRVNGGTFTESTTKNADNEFTVPFTVPTGTTNFVIEAEVLGADGQWQ